MKYLTVVSLSLVVLCAGCGKLSELLSKAEEAVVVVPGNEPGTPPPGELTPKVVWPPASTAFLFPTKAQRLLNWNPAPQTNFWYVDWLATDLPATKRLPYHLWFQNPHDDDLNAAGVRGRCKYRINDPSPGFLTVNRINAPDGNSCSADERGYGGRNFTGNIWKKVETISAASGATFEYEVKIPNLRTQVQHDAVAFTFVGTNGSFTIYHSPLCLKLGATARPGPDRHACASNSRVSARAFDASDFHKYRVVQYPNSLQVDLFLDNDNVPFLSGMGSPLPFVRLYAPGAEPLSGDSEYEHPYFLFGDNTGDNAESVALNEDTSGAYTLKRISARPGAFRPDSPFQAIGDVAVPILPLNHAISSLPGQSFEFDGPLETHLGSAPLRHYSGDAGSTFKIEQGELKIENSAKGSYLFEQVPGLIGNGAWSFEIRVKILPGATERALVFNIWDHIGMFNLLLSPDKIEAGLGGKHVGISSPIPLDLTSNFVTIRLMRPQNSPYVYVYVGDEKRPLIADFPMSGHQMNGHYRPAQVRLWFGNVGQEFAKTTYPQGNSEFIYVENPKINARIDYIRWSNSVPLSGDF